MSVSVELAQSTINLILIFDFQKQIKKYVIVLR